MFIIEDERHAEPMGSFPTLDKANEELRRLAQIPWDEEPNRAPCMGWQKCGRTYEIVEYDAANVPWKELRRSLALEITAAGFVWATERPQ